MAALASATVRGMAIGAALGTSPATATRAVECMLMPEAPIVGEVMHAEAFTLMSAADSTVEAASMAADSMGADSMGADTGNRKRLGE